MVITSKNKAFAFIGIGNSHFRYAIVYVLITLAVLVFLNLYSSQISQQVFYRSKETSMIEKCHLAAAEISGLDVINSSTVAQVVSEMDSLRVTRLIVTDQFGIAIYDSQQTDSAVGKFVLFPEVVESLLGNDVFTWRYHDGIMHSQAATPLVSYGVVTGCVYMMEYDPEQGALIDSLQRNILAITIVLIVLVVTFSLISSHAFSRRLRRILASMRIIRGGDYTHKVNIRGHDELTILGDEFDELTDRLQISESKRRQFVSDASHELKTPLASIKLLTDSILQNDMDPETVREFVQDIGNEADRLNRMSQKLLTLARVEGSVDTEREIVPMEKYVERVLRMLGAIAEENRIRVHTEIVGSFPVLASSDDLYQIIFNLVENGIKYNTPGGKLIIRLAKQEDHMILQVADTGVGIPEESIAHIFERFYRVDKARSRKSGGSGLGLSIVRNMVERNGGTIRVESRVGEGSTFTVQFPAPEHKEVGA